MEAAKEAKRKRAEANVRAVGMSTLMLRRKRAAVQQYGAG
jgi:hypothetical protein